ncbi:MAG TPA: amidohydrolase [Longimicrobiales bacterium]|nr:amidohydrolase [Longimicrobiales bacterium]
MTVAAMEDGQDLLVMADRIYTCAAAGTVGALLIRDGRIAAAADIDALRAAAPHARALDLSGSTITPGLTDAHAHLTEWAFARREVDLSQAGSPTEAAALIAHGAPLRRTTALSSDNGDTALPWIRGRGWNPHLWDETPSRAVLDQIAGDQPVVLQSHDMHALWANSAALRFAGIDAATPDPEGGTIVRDAAGEPTGLLLEWAGQLVTRHIAPPALADSLVAMRDAQAELHTLGITGVHSFPGIHLIDPDPLTVLQAMRAAGDLRLRILQHIALDDLDRAIAARVRSGDGDEWIRTGGVKMFLDGALGSRTAWMREPYEDGSGCGMRIMQPDEFEAVVRRAAEHGIASTVHAIGDAAVCLALDVLGRSDLRVDAMPHRIEHLQCCPAERLSDAARLGIVCSMQPSHLMTDWTIADRHWGGRRARGTYALGSLLRNGTILAFGSDVPVEPVDPRRGLSAAITRQDTSGAPSAGWYPSERIAPLDALRGYTVGPARAAGLAAPHGTLDTGAAADFAAWDHDPCTEPDMIPDMRCTATVVAGEVVYAR